MAYVDDFKMAGPREHLNTMWGMLVKEIDLDDPAPLGRFLGCGQRDVKSDIELIIEKQLLHDELFHTQSKVDVDLGLDHRTPSTPSTHIAHQQQICHRSTHGTTN